MNEPAANFPGAEAVARSRLYLLLARIFRAEADAALLGELRDPSLAGVFSEFGIAIQAIAPDPRNPRELDLLAQEYTQLFLGPGKHVSPHESVQLENGSGRLWGPETGVVKRFIEAAGFDYQEAFHDMPDHISIELEFLGQLASREAEALDSGDDQKVTALRQWQYKFLAEHLGLWVNPFAQAVIATAPGDFYRAFSELLTEYIRSETLYLETVIHNTQGAA